MEPHSTSALTMPSRALAAISAEPLFASDTSLSPSASGENALTALERSSMMSVNFSSVFV